MMIAQYWASLGFRVDKKDLRVVDNSLKHLEKKLRTFGKKLDKNLRLKIDVSNFSVDSKKLNLALGNALDRASNSVVFEISRFSVNPRNLQAALLRASRAAGGGMRLGGGGINTTYIQRSLSPEEWNRREGVKAEEWNRRRRELRADQETRNAARRPRLGSSAAFGGAVGGGIGGRLANAYMPALALVGGGYGLGQINQRNQEVVSAQLMTQAVVQQAGGTAQQGQQSFDWLRAQAQRVGFNYLDAAPDFNKLLSGLTGAGMSVGQGQDVFKGFAELSRVNKLDKTSQNRLFRALSQVAGKNQLMSEELTGQIAEALPGGVAIFAEAYQKQIGGTATGSEAIQQLRKAMESKQVKGNILIEAAQIASERASSGLGAASQASQAEQARFQNALNDQAIIASQAGIESGFTKIFRALATGLGESSALTRSLAEAFDTAATFAERLILFPQSFMRALQGRDSLVADWLGADATAQLREDWVQIKILFDEIMGMETPSWLPTLEATSKEIAAIMGAIADFQVWKTQTGGAYRQIIEDEYYAGGGSTQAQIKGLLKANWMSFSSLFTSGDPAAEYLAQRQADVGVDISPFMGESGFNPKLFWEAMAKQAKEEAVNRFGEQGAGISAENARTYIAEQKIEVIIPSTVETTEDMRNYFKTEFAGTLGKALMEFNSKE